MAQQNLTRTNNLLTSWRACMLDMLDILDMLDMLDIILDILDILDILILLSCWNLQ